MIGDNIKLISNWDELRGLESATHILDIEDSCGWIKSKVESDESYWDDNHYLSTHTFYGSNYTYSTRLLQSCGFNVQLENWDGETEWFDMEDYLLKEERKAKENIENELLKHEFKEQKIYDLLNRLANVRYEMPIFHKCKSCGFEVVDYQLDNNGICNDCREVD